MRKVISIVAGVGFVAALAMPVFASDMTVKGEVVDVACSTAKKEAGKGAGLREEGPAGGHPDGRRRLQHSRRLRREQQRQAARLRGQERHRHRRSDGEGRREVDQRQIDQTGELNRPTGNR
jgi:hypothetical protein